MDVTYRSIEKLEGPLIFIKHQHPVKISTIIKLKTPSGDIRNGRVLEITEDYACIEVFQGTEGLNKDTEVVFLDELFTIGISKEMLGKTFNGQGKLIKNLKTSEFDIIPDVYRTINGKVLNPIARDTPRTAILTGISAIDGLNTIIQGQKIPIFTGQGLPHNKLIAQIIKQQNVAKDNSSIIIFVGIGILKDDLMYFEQRFKESGNKQNIISFINLAGDPTIERILVPRIALTVAEYFAFDLGMDVIVILTDMTNYCEALRELSSAKGEIPSRKGFPGYMYSDLASIYERAGKIKGKKGTITQIPIITMPNDDITHPIPDLTGYISEGQLVLSRDLFKKGIFPPIDILSSLSRIMKVGIGEGKTREDHQELANQLSILYSRSIEIEELESVIGKESIPESDLSILGFKDEFHSKFLKQPYSENRSIIKTLDNGWNLLKQIPSDKLFKIRPEIIKKYQKLEIQ